MKASKLDLNKLKPKNIHLKKFKVKKKFIVLGIIILLIIIFLIVKFAIPKETMISNYTTLQKSQIVNSIDVSGTVESEKVVNVHSKVEGDVQGINVEIGDKVNKGDVLAVLDSEKIKREVNEATAKLNQNKESLKLELDSRKRAYENALYEEKNDMNSEINAAESDLKAKEVSLEETQNDYDYNKELFNYGEVSEQTLKKSKTDFDAAKDAYDQATIALENSKISAKDKLQTAKEDYDAVKLKAKDNSEEIALEDKKEDLKNCEIQAPISGTITSIKAVEGDAANGTLFTIEDLNDVYIEVPIKEVDILNAKVGQKVEIKTDAMEDNKFVEGKVVSVSDTASKEDVSASASSSSGNNAAFKAKIKLNKADPQIKVGMNARIKIIINEAKDIYTVPFDCILDGENGESIYVAEPLSDNKYTIKEIPVTVGIESDVNVEISGKEISDGVIVINDPTSYVAGTEVELDPNMMMGFGGEGVEG